MLVARRPDASHGVDALGLGDAVDGVASPVVALAVPLAGVAPGAAVPPDVPAEHPAAADSARAAAAAPIRPRRTTIVDPARVRTGPERLVPRS